MKTTMYHKFTTASGKKILIHAAYNLNIATDFARREDKTAEYVGIEIKW